MENIRIIKLADETNRDFQIRHITDREGWAYLSDLPVHRDDCYLFLLVESGTGSLDVDFHRIEMTGPELCIIRPGQVHHQIAGKDAKVWVVRFDASFVPTEHISAFEDKLIPCQHFTVAPDQADDMSKVLEMMLKFSEAETKIPLWRQMVSTLLSLFIYQSASIVLQNCRSGSGKTLSRQDNICSRFRKLLIEKGAALRTPAQIAGEMCLSETYLNEVVKRNTGFTVSYWLRENITLEARRQLYFTKKTVKEIAYSVGFDDHIYFSKVFKQHVGMTPGEFRVKYRE